MTCVMTIPPQKGDRFWSQSPNKLAVKQTKPPTKKKSKGKNQAAVAESSDVDESQVGEASSEVKFYPFCLDALLL